MTPYSTTHVHRSQLEYGQLPTLSQLSYSQPSLFGEMLSYQRLQKLTETLLGWIRSVSVCDFVDSRAQGTFQGRQYSGPDLTSVHLPNHVPAEHCSWVTTEVEQLVGTGCIARWADVADSSLYTKPHMVLPLGVEPKKLRLI